MAVLALFKTNHTGPSSTGPLGQHRISGYTGPPLCSWDEKMRCQQKEPFILGTIGLRDIGDQGYFKQEIPKKKQQQWLTKNFQKRKTIEHF